MRIQKEHAIYFRSVPDLEISSHNFLISRCDLLLRVQPSSLFSIPASSTLNLLLLRFSSDSEKLPCFCLGASSLPGGYEISIQCLQKLEFSKILIFISWFKHLGTPIRGANPNSIGSKFSNSRSNHNFEGCCHSYSFIWSQNCFFITYIKVSSS